MSNIIRIPSACSMQKAVPVKNFEHLQPFTESITGIDCIGIIRPSLADVTISKEDKRHAEEIVILRVGISTPPSFYEILKAIYRDIKYHCIVILEYQDKAKISACKFDPGKIVNENNVLKSIVISQWIRNDIQSPAMQSALNRLNDALAEQESLATMYSAVFSAIVSIKQSGISRAHAQRVIEDYLGRVKPKQLDGILQYCTPYQFHQPTPGAGRYSKSRASNYTLIHEYEELWYCFAQHEKLAGYLAGSSFEQIVTSVDMKGW